MGKVYVVYAGPDMTYYGDAEVHAVMSSRGAAEDLARKLWSKDHPNWPWDDVSNLYVGEFEIDDIEDLELEHGKRENTPAPGA